MIVFCPKCGSELITLVPPEEFTVRCKNCGVILSGIFDRGEMDKYIIYELKVTASWVHEEKKGNKV